MPKDIKGFSITLCFGRYAGFYAHAHETNWRICLGWVALTIYFCDLEAYVQTLRNNPNPRPQ